MRIQRIRTRNILGARDIDVRPATAFTLFCGFNGAGKSSIQESLRLAFQGETLRVNLKKDYPLMVSEGAKDGFALLEVDGAEFSFKLPSGIHALPPSCPPADQLHCVLNAQRFASMTADERREFLMALTKSRPNAEKIKSLLLEAGLDPARIEMAIPMLRGGFPAAMDLAKGKATESKGAWKQTAGSVWGSLKGETWEAPEVIMPDETELEAARIDVDMKSDEIDRLNRELGALAERANIASRNATNLATAKKQADSIPRIEEKLTRDREQLASYRTELDNLRSRAGTGPREGLVHDLATFLANLSFDGDLLAQAESLLDRYTEEFGAIGGGGDAEALAKIPAFERSVTLMENSVKNGERDLAAAHAAKAAIEQAGPGDEEVDAAKLAKTKTAVAAATAELAAARKLLAELEARQTAAEKRDEITDTARAHHLDIMGWTKVAEQFAPDGIPSQILAKALEPINKLLRAAATATEWFQVAIGPNMGITASGRMYTLLSESERWMVDAQLAAVIAQLSGLRMLVLDRFDVLDINHRPQLIYWLSDLCEAGDFDQVLVFGTLKSIPAGLPDNVEPIWVSGGEIEGHGMLAKAA